jgi:hypothetical protein
VAPAAKIFNRPHFQSLDGPKATQPMTEAGKSKKYWTDLERSVLREFGIDIRMVENLVAWDQARLP